MGGKYLEGYLQHTQTGYLRKPPLTAEELKQAREQIEEAVDTNPYGYEDDDRYMLYFIQSLLMFDRLAEKRHFQLIIQPLTARDVISFAGRAKRLLGRLMRKREKNINARLDKKIQTFQDLDDLLDELRSAEREEMQEGIELKRAQQGAFDRFVDGVIKNSLDGAVTRILIARDEVSYYFEELRFSTEAESRNPSVIYLAPLFVGKGNKIAEQIASKGKPGNLVVEVTQDEVLYELMLNILRTCLEPCALNSAVDNLAAKFKENTTPQEVREALIPVLQEDADDHAERITNLLNFFGAKTNGISYGNLVKMMLGGSLAQWFQEGLEEARNQGKTRGVEKDIKED